MAGLLIAAIVFGTVFGAELPDKSGLASLALGTRCRPGGVFAGAAAAFAVHVVLAVTCGSLLGLLPHKIVQLAVALVFLGGAVLALWSVAALAMIVMAGSPWPERYGDSRRQRAVPDRAGNWGPLPAGPAPGCWP